MGPLLHHWILDTLTAYQWYEANHYCAISTQPVYHLHTCCTNNKGPFLSLAVSFTHVCFLNQGPILAQTQGETVRNWASETLVNSGQFWLPGWAKSNSWIDVDQYHLWSPEFLWNMAYNALTGDANEAFHGFNNTTLILTALHVSYLCAPLSSVSCYERNFSVQ